MILVCKSEDRGHFDLGWLDTRHTFSFGEYRAPPPRHLGFRSLRVINEDVIAPGQGFGEHPHADMEIVTFVMSGALAHADRIDGGHSAALRPGEVQRISAGAGIVHSEFNASKTDPAHIIQVWIRPDRKGHAPRYDQKDFPFPSRQDHLLLAASPDGADGSIPIHQDARVYVSTLAPGQAVEHPLAPGRGAWLQIIRGGVQVNDQPLSDGDGAAIENEPRLSIKAQQESEFLLFDLK